MSLRNDSPISAWRRRLNAAALTALLCCAPFAAAQEEAPAPEFVEIPAEVLPEPEPQPAVEPERPQVRVEARILEWQMTNGLDFDFAVNYRRNNGSGSILETIGLNLLSDTSLGSAARIFFDGLDVAGGSFELVIEALETAGEVESLAKPYMVLTSRQVPIEELLSGHPQSVQIYEDKGARRLQPEAGHVYNKQEIPYETAAASGNRLISFTQYRSAGLTLDVVVQHVTPDGLVVLDLNTNITDLTGFIRVGLNERNEPMRVPVFDSREIENRLIIPDGTVFLAGLMKTTRQSERERGLPWLSELPIIRWFTTNESRDSQDTELVFLIKPEILTHRPTMAELAETGDLP